MGSTNAALFPVPVWAVAMILSPRSTAGSMAFSWIGSRHGKRKNSV